jgi:hypothetical protein
MPSATTESLRLANIKLRAGLARLQPELNGAPVTQKDLADLRAALLCASDLWRVIAKDPVPDPDVKKVTSEYWSTVEQLAQILPSVYGRLLMEKSRLQVAQAHVTATAAWAQTNQETL